MPPIVRTDQRYFAVGAGRFGTVDPYRNSAHRKHPGSWNRYLYVGGDPINRFDRTGLLPHDVGAIVGCDDPDPDSPCIDEGGGDEGEGGFDGGDGGGFAIAEGDGDAVVAFGGDAGGEVEGRFFGGDGTGAGLEYGALFEAGAAFGGVEIALAGGEVEPLGGERGGE